MKPPLSTCTGERRFERPAENISDPRLRSHSNTSRWDQMGFAVEALRREGYNDTQVARLLRITPRSVKSRRGRIKP